MSVQNVLLWSQQAPAMDSQVIKTEPWEDTEALKTSWLYLNGQVAANKYSQ